MAKRPDYPAEPIPRDDLKELLKEMGYSYRRASLRLGVCYQYLSDFLNGWVRSRALERRIRNLPPSRRKEAAR